MSSAAAESVWDYPRPPAVEPSTARIEIVFGGAVIVSTSQSFRVLETSHPPVYYVARSSVVPGVLRPIDRRTFCEFKGVATYWDVVVDAAVAEAAAWSYPSPSPGYEELLDQVAFYPGRMGSCTVDGETVVAQPGDFYGGWITSAVTGPFKGSPGTGNW